MSDQISRQKLIEELKHMMGHYGRDGLYVNLKAVLNIVNSQLPADQWIPCSRELPKQNQHIIGTFESDKGKRFVCDDTYFPQLLSGPWKLIAWMPAEPYKGEEK